jgi:single-strand DNA-binding protein
MLQSQGVNKVILVGDICGQPQLITTKQGDFLSFNLVTKECYNRNKSTEEHFEFHFVKIPASHIVTEQLEEGTQLYIEGRLNTVFSIDADGIRRYDTCILAIRFQVMVKSPAVAAISGG